MGTTLAQAYDGSLADAAHLDHLRPHTLRAYRYELALAGADPRFACDLAALSLADLEACIARPPASPSTVGRRAATFRRFFAWAVRHGFCAGEPLAGYTCVHALFPLLADGIPDLLIPLARAEGLRDGRVEDLLVEQGAHALDDLLIEGPVGLRHPTCTLEALGPGLLGAVRLVALPLGRGQQTAAGLRAKREAGANLRRDFAEAGHWEELARARGLRLPHWHQPCTQRYMAHWLNRLGIPTAAYLEWAGERSLRVFAQQNPDWGLRAWVGLLLEAIQAGAFSSGASASFRPFPAQDRIA